MGTKRSFAEKLVIITGGAGGLGTAMARAFGAAGAKIGLLDYDTERLQVTHQDLSDLGIDVASVSCDITDTETTAAAISQIQGKYGPVFCLINNAGITHRSAFAETSVEVQKRVMDVSWLGSVNATKAALGGLIETGGIIIGITSVAGFAPLLGRTGYSAAKHAMHGFLGSLRTEVEGVDVLLVSPTFVATDMQERALGGDGEVTTHPQSRAGAQLTAEEVAAKVLRAAQRGKRSLVLGAVGKLTRLLVVFAPALYDRLMKRSLASELIRGNEEMR